MSKKRSTRNSRAFDRLTHGYSPGNLPKAWTADPT